MSASSPLVRLGNFLFRYRNYVFPIVFGLILWLDRPRYPFGSATWDRALDAAGIVLVLAGQALRVLVIGLAYIQRGGKQGRVHADELVIEGLFAHSRNPLYVGNVGIVVGLFVIVNSPLGYGFGIPAVLLAYYSLVVAEEHFLRGKFGSPYEEYCRRVNRFWPALHGLRKTLSGMRFDWQRVIRKEYGSTWTWLTAVVGLLFWERVAVEGFDAVSAQLPVYLVVWVLVTFAWSWARFLKKTRRLG